MHGVLIVVKKEPEIVDVEFDDEGYPYPVYESDIEPVETGSESERGDIHTYVFQHFARHILTSKGCEELNNFFEEYNIADSESFRVRQLDEAECEFYEDTADKFNKLNERDLYDTIIYQDEEELHENETIGDSEFHLIIDGYTIENFGKQHNLDPVALEKLETILNENCDCGYGTTGVFLDLKNDETESVDRELHQKSLVVV